MVPMEERDGYAWLVANGRIAPGSGRTLDEVLSELDAAIPPDEGESVSDALASLRADER